MAFANPPATFEAHLPVDSDTAYRALLGVVRGQHKLKSHDDRRRKIVFRSWHSAGTWGETVTAHVLPGLAGGSALRLVVEGRFSTVQRSARLNRLLFSQACDQKPPHPTISDLPGTFSIHRCFRPKGHSTIVGTRN